MKLQDLKTSIENKTIGNEMLIFKISDIDFIPKQYIRELSKIFNCDVECVEELPKPVNDIFSLGECSKVLKLYETDKLDKVINQDNLYIICKKIDDSIKEEYSYNIIDIPKLEQWQIKDFVYSMAEGVDKKYLDELCEVCHYDIYRLEQEMNKFKIFNDKERNILFNQMIKDGAYKDLSKHTIFDISNAVLRRDYGAIKNLYKQLNSIDCEPLGLITTLYNNFKNIINIQLTNNPTAESCGLNPKQFWAIKNYSCGYYNKEQLVKILDMLTNIDKCVKIGSIVVDERLIDYVITSIFSF